MKSSTIICKKLKHFQQEYTPMCYFCFTGWPVSFCTCASNFLQKSPIGIFFWWAILLDVLHYRIKFGLMKFLLVKKAAI